MESDEESAVVSQGQIPTTTDVDPVETGEWMGSLDYVIKSKGAERVKFLLKALDTRARQEGVDVPFEANTPYLNTIPTSKQPPYPGNREIERRIKSIIRWNAMAMVVRANKKNDGLGGQSAPLPVARPCMKWDSTTSSKAAGPMATVATSSTSKVTHRPACTRGRLWKDACPKPTSITSAVNCKMFRV